LGDGPFRPSWSEDISSISIDDDKLKGLVKQALVEVLQESRSLLYDVIIEAVEDGALARAIKAGEDSPLVDRAEVIKTTGQDGQEIVIQ
jgi:hypothetical protein